MRLSRDIEIFVKRREIVVEINHKRVKRFPSSLFVLLRFGTDKQQVYRRNMDLRHFVSALNDPLTGLTYTAFTGVRKQSVPDYERLFSAGVLKYMQDHSHIEEARFVEVVRNWHKASDGRGIDEATRSSYNKAMLDWLLEDWMPWFRENRDYSTIDVNRYHTLYSKPTSVYK